MTMEQFKKWLDHAKEKGFLQVTITILFMLGMFLLGAQLGKLQNENMKNEIAKNEIARNEITKNEIAKNEITKNGIMKIEEKPKGVSSQSSQEKTQTTSSQKVVQQVEEGILLNKAEDDMLTNKVQEATLPNKEQEGILTNKAEPGTLLNRTEDWGLCFGEAGTEPRANATAAEMEKYDAYYIGKKDEKVMYLTFDCGYENGNTEAILDALKKHNVSATFFVVGHFLDTAPDLVRRMEEDGHSVGNHTEHHPDMSKIATKEALQKELSSVENKYKEITGKEMVKYFRPPQGKYSVENLQNAQQLGYVTFFWSLAYADWDQNKQPSHEEAVKKLTDRAHPGAVVLLHSTSKTNGEIMDELLTKWEEMGYRFGTLGELLKK